MLNPPLNFKQSTLYFKHFGESQTNRKILLSASGEAKFYTDVFIVAGL